MPDIGRSLLSCHLLLSITKRACYAGLASCADAAQKDDMTNTILRFLDVAILSARSASWA